MNLLDMLSADAPEPVFQIHDANDMQSILEHAAPDMDVDYDDKNGDTEIIQPNDGVYYLPCVLSKLQAEISEIVLQLLKSVLLTEAYKKKQRASINSLLDNSMDGDDERKGNLNDFNDLSHFDKVDLLFDQLKTINKHPSLLVDHFIPKKLILSEVNERLTNLSGKFQLFNRIVNSLIDRYPQTKFDKNSKKGGFHILIVAESVKELELIEGLIIGKKLYYKNLSSRKLYDDNRDIPIYKNADTRRAELNPNYEGRPMRKSRIKSDKNHRNDDEESYLCLYLLTSQQLYNNYTPSSNSKNSEFQLIISFDTALDRHNPSIELIRSRTESQSLTSTPLKTPIIIPTLLYTLDHLALEIPAPNINGTFNFNNRDTSSPIFKWKSEILNTFAVNRFKLFDSEFTTNFYVKTYGSNMNKLYKWFHKWDTLDYPLLDKFAAFNEEIILNYRDERLIKKLETNYIFDTDLLPHKQEKKNFNRIKLEPKSTFKASLQLDKFSYDEYKRKLAELLNERVFEIDDALTVNLKTILPSKRLGENLRQLSLDKQEEDIANQYKKLRKLNDTATSSEKKLNKVDNDLSRLTNTKVELTEKLQFLQSMIAKPDEELPQLIETQDETLKTLNEELKNLITEFDKLNDENEEIRSKYQTSSSEAVQLSSRLLSCKEQNGKLSSKLNGPGSNVLPSLIKKDDLINYELELTRSLKQNEFISLFFSEKVDNLIKERNTILDNTTSGSSSRPNNRISRGSTPF